MKLIPFLTPICFLAVLAMPMASANGSSVYIAAQASDLGTGTQADPFDGSTAAKFDALMKSIPQNTQIFLGAGTFMTNGFDAFEVKPGWVIQGAGMGKTILKLVGHPSVAWHKHYHLASASSDNVHISNLTCDGNYQGYPWAAHEVVGGVSPFGSNVVIDSVETINCYGDTVQGLEEFSILLGGPNSQAIKTNCVIKNCLTHSYAPGANYTNGPMISYCQGAQIINCTDDGSNHGFGFAGDSNAELRGSTTSRQTVAGFYTDTAGNDGITIDGNSLSSNGMPIQFNSQESSKNVTISNNALESSKSNGAGSAAILLSGIGGGSHFTITGNVFTYTGTSLSGLILNISRRFSDLDVEDNSSNVGLNGAGGNSADITEVGVVHGNKFNEPIASLTPPADSPDSSASLASDQATEPAPPTAPAAPAAAAAPITPAATPAPSDSASAASDPTEAASSPKVASAPSDSPSVPKQNPAPEENSPEQLAKQIQNDTAALVQRDLSTMTRTQVSVAGTSRTNFRRVSRENYVATISPNRRVFDKVSAENQSGGLELVQPLTEGIDPEQDIDSQPTDKN